MPLALCDPNLVPVASHDWQSCCTPFWSSWGNKCRCAIYNFFSITWCYMPAPKSDVAYPFNFLDQKCSGDIADAIHLTWCWWSHDQKAILGFILIILTKQMQWWYWWCQQCHVMPTLVSHIQRIHVAPCFNHLDLTSKMVPLTMPSVSCDSHTGSKNLPMTKRVMSHFFFNCHHLIRKWCHWWCS